MHVASKHRLTIPSVTERINFYVGTKAVITLFRFVVRTLAAFIDSVDMLEILQLMDPFQPELPTSSIAGKGSYIYLDSNSSIRTIETYNIHLFYNDVDASCSNTKLIDPGL